MPASQDLIEGWRALDEAQGAYEQAMNYYRGNVAESFASAAIARKLAEAGQAYPFRLASIPVKVLAKRCRINNVISDIEAVSRRLEEIREANQASIHESHLIRRALIFGDALAMIWPVELEEAAVDQADGETADVAPPDQMAEVGVEISYQSPLHCRVIYDSEDGRRPRFAIRRWLVRSPLGEAQDYWRAEVWYHDRFEPWVTREGAGGGTAEDWMPWAEDEVTGERVMPDDTNWPIDHDWDEIPIKHARTDLPYGEPVHSAAYGPQNAITKAITTQIEAGVEGWGWPERYRILSDQKELEHGRDPVPWDDVADVAASVGAVPEARGRHQGPGTETTYPNTKAVGQWERPDPGVLIAPIEQWVRLMSVVSETPLYELDPTVQVSGISRDKADAPMKARERDIKLYLDAFWVEVYSLAVRMSGIDEPGAISVQWAPPDVTMDSDFWTTSESRVRLGVPVAQVLAEANYLPEQVEAWLDAQGEGLALEQRIHVMEKLGAAIQSLGVGIQLGVLDQATAARLVSRVTGEVESEPNR